MKEKLGKTKISTEFTEGILHIAKGIPALELEYVTRIANKANEICTAEKKKTISLDHLYKSV
ncbi:MAG: NFYB/HAP3 family transcription factor subunit [Actinobacteria bacterium]|nr:NFYB/HAP3 family transcription factor subunit [Actinomycetota bacterium]